MVVAQVFLSRYELIQSALMLMALFFALLMPGEWRTQKRKWAPLAIVVLSGVGAAVQLVASLVKVVRILRGEEEAAE